ncbi:hypothetical protein [Achromobacter xylosoxidans]|uniref:hypothetical protein n=1 Tax=Alcaligenes xylosoxydans xylosoxydans TaxID=85698 RepID=UPI003F772674
MTNRAEFERLLDVYGFRCERFGQDLSTHARAQVVSAFAALASAPVADVPLTHRCANCGAVFQGAGCPSCRLAAPVASAPVAEPGTMEEIHRQERERSPWVLPKDPTLPDSAPVAGEAKNYPGENVAERLDNMADDQPPGSQAQSDLYAAATIWRKHIAHRAAPQASEAVRQQRAGDVVALLVYKSKGRPGAHGQTLGANGAGEFAVLYRGDEFAALVKANEEIRALEAAGHRLDFAAIIHGEGYSGPMLRQEYVTRAALSAQPGAQRTGGSDAG